jgi:hypothetical protein
MHTFFKSLTNSMLMLVLPVAILPMAVLPTLVLPALAQAQPATADQQGNYFRNETPVQAPRRYSKLAAGSLWEVVVSELNCRSSPSFDGYVKRLYLLGDLLEVEVYRGGSDEVSINPTDLNGRPWMPVRGVNREDVCYVRANSRYIQPVN